MELYAAAAAPFMDSPGKPSKTRDKFIVPDTRAALLTLAPFFHGGDFYDIHRDFTGGAGKMVFKKIFADRLIGIGHDSAHRRHDGTVS
jgi:hypothetical protein